MEYTHAIKNRKCGVDSRLFVRRLWKDLTVINEYNAPHLDSMGIGTLNAYSHIAIQEMSAARHPTVLKTSTFSNKDCEKHFQYVCYLSNSNTKLKRISETNNTLAGH